MSNPNPSRDGRKGAAMRTLRQRLNALVAGWNGCDANDKATAVVAAMETCISLGFDRSRVKSELQAAGLDEELQLIR